MGAPRETEDTRPIASFFGEGGRFAAFRPKLLESLRHYDRASFSKDLIAGLTVGVVALPLAMAFGIASGVKPESGIFTAIIAGFLISALGGSRVQIGGPAGAFVVVIYAIIERYGLANLFIATAMAGLLLFAMGLLKIGNLIRFIPVPIVIGFTNGIAVLIGLSQLKEFFGLQISQMPADFFAKIVALLDNAHTFDAPTLGLSVAALVLIVTWPRLTARSHLPIMLTLAKIPGSVIALILATAVVSLGLIETETIGSRFGGIPQGLPAFALPQFSWETAKNLLAPTITIALLGAIESLLCARVADSMTDDRHDPNQELMAQGVANFVVPFFGGIPATGTIARTVTNIRSGGQTPIAGITHAFALLLIVLLAAPLAQNVPLAVLSAILLFVAWNMGEWKEFKRLRQFSVQYQAILISTFLLTVIFDLTVAVEVGLVLASLFFIFRIASLTRLTPETTALPNVEAYRINGALFFGSVGKLEGLMASHRTVPALTILDFSGTINLDTTGLDALESLRVLIEKRGAELWLAGVHDQPESIMRRSGFLAHFGPEALHPTLAMALDSAKTRGAGPAAAP